MKVNKYKGISLIVLVITIIVIIILAGAVILGLADNNPIEQAAKATFISDLRNFETELLLYETKQFVDKMGIYNPDLLQADETSVTYDGNVDTTKTMYDLMPTLGRAAKYAGQFQVIDGKLVFKGSNIKEQNWATEAGTGVLIIGEPIITILPPTQTVVTQGTDIVYTVQFSSNAALTTIDLTGKIEVLDDAGVALPIQPVITIGTISGTSADTTRQVDITIKTDGLANAGYKLKIKAAAIVDANNKSNSQDIISLIGFNVDNTAPANPTMSVSPTGWVSSDVSVTITYSGDTTVKEYSLDGTTWQVYISPVIVTTNNTTVYARRKEHYWKCKWSCNIYCYKYR